MGNLFEQERNIDTRKRRRFFQLLKKIERISAVVLIWLMGAALLYAIYTAAFLKPYFDVDKIEVEGTFRVLTKDKIISKSGIKMGDHLLRLPVGEIQARLEKSPWIKEVAVHRKFPHMVWIYVKEYIPEAIVRKDGWHYVNRFGQVFKTISLEDDRDFPIITGLEEIPDDDEAALKSKVVELLRVKKLYESSSLGEIFGISEIHFNENKGVSIVTMVDPMELRLGYGPFVEKIDRLQIVYPAIRSRGGVVAYIDFNSEGKVVVKYGI